MKVHQEPLSDVTRYIENNKQYRLTDMDQPYQNYLRLIRKFKPIDARTEMLEIGTGTGWFPIMCKRDGLRCKGLEISPQLIEFAKEFGRQNGVEPDIELGNIEEQDIGNSRYDVIVAQSVFEHIEHWQLALERIYKALRPDGLFLFSSTNKFSFTSGEYKFPLYGWLPDQLRYKLRIAAQGPEIMKLGIDFNQFRYPLLRREFQRVGFRKIYDRVDIADPQEVVGAKKAVVSISRKVGLVRGMVLAFSDATVFACIK